MIFHNGAIASVMVGDCLTSLRALPDRSVNCCVTSPPYFGLRDYGHEGQIGLEDTPDAYVARLVEVFREVRRLLTDDGTLWLNIGDSYSGKGGHGPQAGQQFSERMRGQQIITKAARYVGGDCKEKDLIGIPWLLAFALRADGAVSPAHMRLIEEVIATVTASYDSRNQWPDKLAALVERLEREHLDANRGGWYLRQEIIWHKPNPMPESVTDRCTKAHEQIFLLSKSPRYYFDNEAIKEPAIYAPGKTKEVERAPGYYAGKHAELNESGRNDVSFKAIRETRNKRSVWTVAPRPYAGAHFAVYPPELITPCILAGCPVGGVVLDPFGGSGTTAGVSLAHGRNALMMELNPEYAALMPARVQHIVERAA